MTTDSQIFVSKRDRWLEILMWAAVVGSTLIVGETATLSSTPGEMLTIAGLLVLVDGLILWTLYGTWYRFEGERLKVHSGPFRWTIRTAAITEVYPTTNPLSSPACSIHRLAIVHERGKKMMISPKDRDQFLRELTARNPGLTRDGEHLKAAT